MSNTIQEINTLITDHEANPIIIKTIVLKICITGVGVSGKLTLLNYFKGNEPFLKYKSTNNIETYTWETIKDNILYKIIFFDVAGNYDTLLTIPLLFNDCSNVVFLLMCMTDSSIHETKDWNHAAPDKRNSFNKTTDLIKCIQLISLMTENPNITFSMPTIFEDSKRSFNQLFKLYPHLTTNYDLKYVDVFDNESMVLFKEYIIELALKYGFECSSDIFTINIPHDDSQIAIACDFINSDTKNNLEKAGQIIVLPNGKIITDIQKYCDVITNNNVTDNTDIINAFCDGKIKIGYLNNQNNSDSIIFNSLPRLFFNTENYTKYKKYSSCIYKNDSLRDFNGWFFVHINDFPHTSMIDLMIKLQQFIIHKYTHKNAFMISIDDDMCCVLKNDSDYIIFIPLMKNNNSDVTFQSTKFAINNLHSLIKNKYNKYSKISHFEYFYGDDEKTYGQKALVMAFKFNKKINQVDLNCIENLIYDNEHWNKTPILNTLIINYKNIDKTIKFNTTNTDKIIDLKLEANNNLINDFLNKLINNSFCETYSDEYNYWNKQKNLCIERTKKTTEKKTIQKIINSLKFEISEQHFCNEEDFATTIKKIIECDNLEEVKNKLVYEIENINKFYLQNETQYKSCLHSETNKMLINMKNTKKIQTSNYLTYLFNNELYIVDILTYTTYKINNFALNLYKYFLPITLNTLCELELNSKLGTIDLHLFLAVMTSLKNIQQNSNDYLAISNNRVDHVIDVINEILSLSDDDLEYIGCNDIKLFDTNYTILNNEVELLFL